MIQRYSDVIVWIVEGWPPASVCAVDEATKFPLLAAEDLDLGEAAIVQTAGGGLCSRRPGDRRRDLSTRTRFPLL
jgi:hypothetical protein